LNGEVFNLGTDNSRFEPLDLHRFDSV